MSHDLVIDGRSVTFLKLATPICQFTMKVSQIYDDSYSRASKGTSLQGTASYDVLIIFIHQNTW